MNLWVLVGNWLRFRIVRSSVNLNGAKIQITLYGTSGIINNDNHVQIGTKVTTTWYQVGEWPHWALAIKERWFPT